MNYRTPRDLLQCVRSLVKDADGLNMPIRVIIVNVAPTDEDDRMVFKIEHDYWNGLIEHLGFEQNIGYGRACNLGVRHPGRRWVSAADYLLFCNADIEFTPDSLVGMLTAMEDNPDWGVLGPRQVNPAGELVHAGIFGTRAEPRHRAWKHPDSDRYADIAPAVSVSGSVYMVRRACWDQLLDCETYAAWAGGSQSIKHCGLPESAPFLPTPFYYEETWFSYHAIEHGWKVIYYGPVRMIHNWHNSVRTNNAERWAADQMRVSQAMFRECCDAHGIPHD